MIKIIISIGIIVKIMTILMMIMTAGRLSSSYNVPGQLMLQGSVGRGEELEVSIMLMLMLMLILLMRRRKGNMIMVMVRVICMYRYILSVFVCLFVTKLF